MRQQQPSNGEASRGFTLMIMGAPGQKPRRIYVPHWAFGALLGGWIVLMVIAAWFGFQSSESPVAEPVGSASSSVVSQSSGASAVGLSAKVSGSKSVARSAPVSSPLSRQE